MIHEFAYVESIGTYKAMGRRALQALYSGFPCNQGVLVMGLALVISFNGLPQRTAAGQPSQQQVEFFEKKVRPLLAERCFGCHSHQAKEVRGKLMLDSLAGMLEGGSSGPAIVPSAPEQSRLIRAIRYVDEDLKMPPKRRLTDEETELLTRWVKMGAPWPNARAISRPRNAGQSLVSGRNWWAFKPVEAASPPATGAGWARNSIDRFVASRLDEAHLSPAPEASRATLIRRLTFDLTGLPPTPQAVHGFVHDPGADAYEKLVDRLLASPQYGERWARHWLDLVHYADSDGYRVDDYRPNAWRYRDYVIQSFNADKPYDRFVQEQLAGDELFPGDPDALVATGYLRQWVYEYNQRDVRGQWKLILDDITDTTGDVFLGLSLQCARCHDHKFDPILQKDYFRLRAFFVNVLPRDDLIAATDRDRAEHAAQCKAWETSTEAIRNAIVDLEAPYRAKAASAAIQKFPDDIQAMIRKPAADRSPLEHQLAELAYRQVGYEFDRLERTVQGADKEKLLALRRQLASFDRLKPPPLPMALATVDVGPTAPPVTIPKKGSDHVEPGFLTLLDEKPARVSPLIGAEQSTGRRAALARWLSTPQNPLTARVIVNRVWQQHFGRGLVASTSDLGWLGGEPTHPALLDWLADHFIKDGWSLKNLHRLIVTSATYRQSANHPNPLPGRVTDPENKLLWRGTVHRLDAEQIRDAIYSVTGELDANAGGPGAAHTEPRRSIYARIMRNNRDPLLDVFDAPLWFSSASSRDTTTTPVQALLLVNSPFMLARARALADRLARGAAEDADRVTLAYRLALGRAPSASERTAAVAFLRAQETRVDPSRIEASAAAFAPGKIPYRDGQAAEFKLGSPACFQVPHSDKLPAGTFTIEAFVYPKSIAETGVVRIIAAKWNGDLKQPGWAFGITGKQSRRKPQTAVLQMVGQKLDGRVGEEAVFSDQHIALNKPYYLAAAVQLATTKTPGLATFYLKDLSNDDEPLLAAKVQHAIAGGLANKLPLTLGGRASSKGAEFDGLLDDVRLSAGVLGIDQLLFTREGTNQQTIGYWQFEAKPDVWRDSSSHGLELRLAAPASSSVLDPRQAAWVDLCQVLLNASEFLYVE